MSEPQLDTIAKPSVTDAYVSEEERVLDPAVLDKSLVERMPEPSGWRLLVLPYKGKGVTDGGIQLLESTMDKENLSTSVCYVLKVGPLAYQDESKFNGIPWCEETLTEALSKLDSDESINKAALPESRRVEEDVQEESTYIDLSEDEAQSINPITDDAVKEDFDDEPSQSNDEEISETEKRTRGAQKRINKAVAQAKEYQRRELQALQYAKELKEQNQNLSTQLISSQASSTEQNMKLQEGYKDEFENRVDTQAEAAKKALKTAYEAGDPDTMAEAQQMLAKAEADRTALNRYKQEYDDYKVQYKNWSEEQQAQREYEVSAPQQQIQQEPLYQEPSVKSQGWAEDNEWFGTDQVMTNVAFAIHQELTSKGIDAESDEYYSQIDNRMRQELPHKFTNAGNNPPVQTVVSGTRTTGTGRNQNNRRIELSPSEQQLARKLGVPFKEYAKQKMRLQRS